MLESLPLAGPAAPLKTFWPFLSSFWKVLIFLGLARNMLLDLLWSLLFPEPYELTALNALNE